MGKNTSTLQTPEEGNETEMLTLPSPSNELDLTALYEEGISRCGDPCQNDAQSCLGDETDMDFKKMLECYDDETFTISSECTTCIEGLIDEEQSKADQMMTSQGTGADSTSPVVPVLAAVLAAVTLLLIILAFKICKEMQRALSFRSYNDKLHLVDGSAGPAPAAYDTTTVTVNP